MAIERVATRKPSRSDELPLAEEQERLAAAVRGHFEAAAPRRPPKPARSESSDAGAVGSGSEEWQYAEDEEIPEVQRLRDLASRSEPFPTGGGVVVSGDEYSENEYYKGLNSVAEDGQHYTTGAGFIKVENHGATGEHLAFANEAIHRRMRCRSNPAMNDWEPTPQMVFPVSHKPPRSDP